MKLTLLRNLLLCSALPFLAVACGGGGDDDGGSGTTVSTDLLITDATVDELLSFTVKLQSLRLVNSSTGALTPNVLEEDLAIELIGAGLAPRWVSRARLPVGTYSAVEATLDDTPAPLALDLMGAPVAVTQTATTFTTNFPTPLSVVAGNFPRIVLDIDLGASLTGSVATPPIVFNPTGIVTTQPNATTPIGIDEVEGVVRSVNGTTDFVIDAFADDDRTIALGLVTITPSPTALLLDDNGIAYANVGAFFAALTPNVANVEVHGELVNGGILASRIEVEDAGAGVAYTVKLEGIAQNVDTTLNTFDLLVIEAEKGGSIANPLIMSLGNPISCDYDGATAIFVLDENTPTTEASLVSGQRIKAKFATFIGEPFRAVLVEIEGQPEFEGVITSIAGLPNTLVMNLLPGNLALGGSVATTTTNITVDLTASSLFLDTEGDPVLTTSQLKVGQELEVRGLISGPNTAPTVVADRTEIHAGRARGFVTWVSQSYSDFTFTISDLEDPFGGTITLGPATGRINASCVFDGEASSAQSFYNLFNGLGQGESLEVEVHGLGLSNPNEIEAYEIEAEIDD
ncbi:MAG: hypothetical protein FJ294_12345 [Planctomycetes bacterium]|nr:hypothetical protein [Planctomycetota bacterium]